MSGREENDEPKWFEKEPTDGQSILLLLCVLLSAGGLGCATQATAVDPSSPNEVMFALFMAIVVPLLAMSRSNGYMMMMFKTIPNYFVLSISFLLLTRAAQRYYVK